MTNKHNFSLYQPDPEPRTDGLRLWVIDLIGGALWILAIVGLVFLCALAVMAMQP